MMRQETRNKLDSALMADRWKMVAKFGVVVLVIALVAGYNVPVRFETLHGTSGERGIYHTDTGEVHRVDVTLVSGEKILASLSQDIPFEQDRSVEVQAGYSLFGVSEYRIIRFIEPPSVE